eukprot:CAMPEP_0197530978 /NCGR_PEP_ID=MMETSP1318-20131121/33642_1 /TAXON_ID=552666 /ORGANISM="Partenskyella glossopodia, Strain RCC365" /LENGTH=276 /DNA_ID=CAMNT_0043087019 /DNA_START=202 /DNA_END=1032 /DNA_ORIENTATION=-
MEMLKKTKQSKESSAKQSASDLAGKRTGRLQRDSIQLHDDGSGKPLVSARKPVPPPWQKKHSLKDRKQEEESPPVAPKPTLPTRPAARSSGNKGQAPQEIKKKAAGPTIPIIPDSEKTADATVDGEKIPEKLTEQHDYEIKQIMQALERGGSKAEVEVLEARLSRMSKRISMADKPAPPLPKRRNSLPPIQEDGGRRGSSGSGRTGPDHTSDSSSGEESIESSSSETEGEGGESSAAQQEHSNGPGYVSKLKNNRQIDALHDLATMLPKIRRSSVV